MTPRTKNIEETLKRDLPSASKEEMEWDVARVLRRIQARADHAAADPVDERIAAFEQTSSLTSSSTWRRFAIIPSAAAVILAVFIGITWRQDAFAVVESVDGTLVRVVDGKTEPLRAGEKVGAGISVRSDGGTGAVLKLADGARIEMHGRSELSLEQAMDGTRIRLNVGSVSVTPSKDPAGNLYVQNREVTVPVVGTTVQSAGAATPPAVPSPRFEVASVRPTSAGRGGGGGERGTGPVGGCSPGNFQIDPQRFAASNVSLYSLIAYAYSTERIEGNTSSAIRANALDLFSGGPSWIRTDCFDVQAGIPEGFPTYTMGQFVHADAPVLQKMLQNLLEDRFKLAIRKEAKEMQIYELRLGRNGAKHTTIEGQDWLGTNTLKEKLPPMMAAPNSRGFFQTGTTVDPVTGMASQIIAGRKVSMSEIISAVSLTVRRHVVDRTGLAARYNLDLEFAPPNYNGPTIGSSIFNVLEDQLGLRLESARGPVETWIIAYAEKPSEN